MMRAVVDAVGTSSSDITEDLKVLYDAATGSMNWGSGFLDTDEVAAIRRIATLMGFQDVDYPLDRCRHCDHSPHSHYPPPQRDATTAHGAPCRQQCTCTAYERRHD